MINFIKNLFGFGPAQETVKEILTPPAKSDPLATAVTAATYIEPAKPIYKVRAITDTDPNAVKAAVSQKSANNKRRPHRSNKVKAGAKVTESSTKGSNGAVKPAQVAKAKPAAPKAPMAKKK
jgi:hypothetical protein